jgi:hypothetical protein
MTLSPTMVILSGLIIAILAARAFWVVRKEKGAPRGSEPGKGYHEIEANYFSGGGGGGQQGSFKVPKDPQEYARQFIPPKRK